MRGRLAAAFTQVRASRKTARLNFVLGGCGAVARVSRAIRERGYPPGKTQPFSSRRLELVRLRLRLRRQGGGKGVVSALTQKHPRRFTHNRSVPTPMGEKEIPKQRGGRAGPDSSVLLAGPSSNPSRSKLAPNPAKYVSMSKFVTAPQSADLPWSLSDSLCDRGSDSTL
jgi:hypothetical protein